MSLRQIIAVNVLSLRLERGWTQTELAQRSKLTSQYVNKVEKTQDANLTVDNLEKLANGLEISVAELVSPIRKPVVVEKSNVEMLHEAIRLLESLSTRVTS